MERATQTYGRGSPRTPLPVRIRVPRGRALAHSLRQGRCVIGAGHDVDLVIDDETVSRRHVQLNLVPEGVELSDLGSRNGTFYMGQRVHHMTLSPGSRIRLGRVELCIDADEDSIEPSSSVALDRYGGLIGSSPAMQRIYAVLERLEGSLVSVLVTGESGTGKEVVARTIHEHSLVAKGPFVAVNCGALDRALVRSELFGHARGAFTGAVESRSGAFESAANGTLFLDEVGELPLETQPVLLRALETGSIQRVGETEERKVKVRLVTATNRKLEELVREGRFREDLYYRLLVVSVALPPLAERRADISDLVRHFAAELGLPAIPDQVLAQFNAREWPGNVRELRNVVQAYAALGAIPPTSLGPSGNLNAALRATIDLNTPYAALKEQLLERFLQVYLELLLSHTKGNQTEAARISGIDRSHLNRVLRKHS